MRPLSALVLHADERFRTEAGRRLRTEPWPVFFASSASEALEVLADRALVRVVAVPDSEGEVLGLLASRRRGLVSFGFTGTSVDDLVSKLRQAWAGCEARGRGRLAEALGLRLRRRAREACERLQRERLERLVVPLPRSGAAGS